MKSYYVCAIFDTKYAYPIIQKIYSIDVSKISNINKVIYIIGENDYK